MSNSQERELQTRLAHLRAMLPRGDLVRTLLYLGGSGAGDPGPEGPWQGPFAEARETRRLVLQVRAWARLINRVDFQRILALRLPANGYFESLGTGGFRIELQVELKAGVPLDMELLELVLQEQPSPGSHYGFSVDGLEGKVGWSWPLRAGTLSGPLGNPWLAPTGTDAAFWMKEMVEVRPLDGASGAFDVLVFPGGIEEAIQAVLAVPRLPRVHTLVILGEGTRRKGWLDRLAFLRRQSGAGLILWNPVPEPRQYLWLEAWVREICHDLPLGFAAASAARRLDLPAPLVFGSAPLMDSRVSGAGWNLVARASRATSAAPPSVAGQESRGLRRRKSKAVPSREKRPVLKMAQNPALEALAAEASAVLGPGNAGAFDQEILGARNLARLSRQFDDLTQEAAPDPGTGRFVQVSVRDTAAPRVVHHGPLAPGRIYDLQTWIGAPKVEALVFSAAFPEFKLPHARDGHSLTVVFTAPGFTAQPQVQKLWLPRTGDSKRVSFLLPSGNHEGPFRSRILVLYRNRVLQTVILAGSVGQGESIHLEPEFENQALTEDLEAHPSFEGAFLFNHGEDGEPAATVVAGGAAQWLPLSNTLAAAFPAKIQGMLFELSKASWKVSDLMSPQAQELLANLARNGSEVYRILDKELGLDASIAKEGRIQVLSANPDSIFPVEFLYVDAPPDADATLCPHAPAALLGRDAGCPEGCGRHDTVTLCRHGSPGGDTGSARVCPGGTYTTVCPFAFWGIRKVVERQHYQPRSSTGQSPENLQFQVGQLQGRKKLEVLRSILLGASDRATKVDPKALDALVAEIRALHSTSATVLKDWSNWKDCVAQTHPSLLILVAHTGMDEERAIATVEIGSTPLLRTSIDVRYTGGTGENAPMVWLLGCSTAISARDTASLVGAFRMGGAVVVVGTLAPTLGVQVGPVAGLLLEELAAALKAGSTRLGEVMQNVRKRMVAQGALEVLNLVAFGDSEWELV